MRLFAGIFKHCERRSKSTFEVEQVWKKSYLHSEIKLGIWCYKSASLTTNGSTNEALESDIEREKRSREEALPTKLLSYPLRLAQGGSIKSLDERGVIRRRPLYIPLNKKGGFSLKRDLLCTWTQCWRKYFDNFETLCCHFICCAFHKWTIVHN